MKKNGMFLLLIYVLVFASMNISAGEKSVDQEKDAARKKIPLLQRKKELRKIAYDQAMQSPFSENEKNQLYERFTKETQELSHQITEQQRIAESVNPEKKWFWRTATALGTATLVGLAAYKLFVTPTTMLLPNSPVIVPLPEGDDFETGEPLIPKPVISVSSAIPNAPVSVEPPAIIKDKNLVPEPLEQAAFKQPAITQDENRVIQPSRPLTSEEIALYNMRYKNYRNGALWSFLGTAASLWLVGPVALPIDALLFFQSLLSADRALHYKKQIKSGVTAPSVLINYKNTDTTIHTPLSYML